jgi:unspecific monooxygenase
MSAESVASVVGDLPDASALGFDPSDASFIADPYPVLARMRDAGRVLSYEPRNVFLLTRFADVHAALRHRGLGRAYLHRYTGDEFGQPDPDPRWQRWADSERYSLLNLEPPDHTRIRRLVTKVFTAKAVAALRPAIERISAATLDRAFGGASRSAGDSGRPTDLILDYAQPYSVAVICQLLGVPADDGPRLLDWSHSIVKMYEFAAVDGERERAERAADEFIGYVRALVAARRAHPRDDLITELAQVADQGDRLTEDEIVSTVIVLLNAGHEATVNTLGNGTRGLLRHPDQWRRIVDGEVDPMLAVEEMVRWDAPLQLFERWVLEDGVELGGRTFAVGERIGMLFGSANRDPGRFPDADAFDIGRGDATHIGFGGGVHFCIGAPLARLEIAVSLEQLRVRAPGLTLVEQPEYQPYFVIRGLRGLRVSAG